MKTVADMAFCLHAEDCRVHYNTIILNVDMHSRVGEHIRKYDIYTLLYIVMKTMTGYSLDMCMMRAKVTVTNAKKTKKTTQQDSIVGRCK